MKILKQTHLDLFTAIFPGVYVQTGAGGDVAGAVQKTLDAVEIALDGLHEVGIIKNDAPAIAALKVRAPGKFREL